MPRYAAVCQQKQGSIEVKEEQEEEKEYSNSGFKVIKELKEAILC